MGLSVSEPYVPLEMRSPRGGGKFFPIHDVHLASLLLLLVGGATAQQHHIGAADEAKAILASAPSKVVVTGLTCDPNRNAVYILQKSPLRGRPHYATADQSFHLYWTLNALSGSGAQWLIDSSTDQSAGNGDAFLVSAAAFPPSGSALWTENCESRYRNSRLALTARFDAGWCSSGLAGIAAKLSAACCQSSTAACLQGGNTLPRKCSLDCAAVWAPFSANCAETIDAMPAALRHFFGNRCTTAVKSLHVLPPSSSFVKFRKTLDFNFRATAGTRYVVDARAGVEGHTCKDNAYDKVHGLGKCDILIRNRVISCSGNGAPGAQYDHYCDASCERDCSLTSIILYVLPPGASKITESVAKGDSAVGDRGLAFTASTTGTFTARVFAYTGFGQVSVAATAVGTALFRAPVTDITGKPAPLSVHCDLMVCDFAYRGATMLDSDVGGFELRLQTRAGTAVAIEARMKQGEHTGVQMKLTTFSPDAAAGADGFAPTLSNAMGGPWTKTPLGHQSYAEANGCATSNLACIARVMGTRSFRIHPEGTLFKHSLTGTAVIATSSPLLMRLALNCDVKFFADIQRPSCVVRGISYGCRKRVDDSCWAQLTISITPGAYFKPQTSGSSSTAKLVTGSSQQSGSVVLGRAELEAQMARMFHATPKLHRVLLQPPKLEDALVSGSEGAALLAKMFTVERQPLLAYPTKIQPLSQVQLAATNRSGPGGHRRFLQENEGALAGIHVSVQVDALTEVRLASVVDEISGQRSECGQMGRRRLDHRSGSPAENCTAVVRDLHARIARLERELTAKNRQVADLLARSTTVLKNDDFTDLTDLSTGSNSNISRQLQESTIRVPDMISVKGLGCHSSGNKNYWLQPLLINGHSHWATADGSLAAGSSADRSWKDRSKSLGPSWNLYWSAAGRAWVLNRGMVDSNTEAYFLTTQDACVKDCTSRPPLSETIWKEYCSELPAQAGGAPSVLQKGGHGGWRSSAISLVHKRFSSSCALSAAIALANPACSRVSSENCPLVCAGILLSARESCGADVGHTHFDAQTGTELACSKTARATFPLGSPGAAAMANAPSSITVTGLTCGKNAAGQSYHSRDGEYILQRTPFNARPWYVLRPHYAGAPSGPPDLWDLYLFWSLDGGGARVSTWRLTATKPSERACFKSPEGVASRGCNEAREGDAQLISFSTVPPAGSSNWHRGCSSRGWKNARITLTPNYNEAWCTEALAQLGPLSQATCCTPGDGRSCGVNGKPPSTCSLDCAVLWAPLQDQCAAMIHSLPQSLQTFIVDTCQATADSAVVLPPTTSLSTEGQFDDHDFTFAAVAGRRYQVNVRIVDVKRPVQSLCRGNRYDVKFGVGQCNAIIKRNPSHCVDGSFCPTCKEAGYCDAACGLLCTQGNLLWATSVYIMPPHVGPPLENGLAVAVSTRVSADRSFAFTAPATGNFSLRVFAQTSGGAINIYHGGWYVVSINAIGTALHTAPPVVMSGVPTPLTVKCDLGDCSFGYNHQPMLDGDYRGFELRLQVPVAGTAVAIKLTLDNQASVAVPNGVAAVHARLVVFEPEAAAGSAGFEPLIDAPLGNWPARRKGHQTYAENSGCANDDRACIEAHAGAVANFEVHSEGGSFGNTLAATAIITTSAPVLLRLRLNCPIRFFTEIDRPGCHIIGDQYGCGFNTVDTECAAALSMTATVGAYVSSAKTLVSGEFTRTDQVVLSRDELEAQASRMFHASPKTTYPSLQSPITLKKLQGNSEGTALLARMFHSRQSPHQVIPFRFTPVMHSVESPDEGQAQMTRMFRLNVTLKASAPSQSEVDLATVQVVDLVAHKQTTSRLGDVQISNSVCGLGSKAVSCTERGEMHVVKHVEFSRSELEAEAARMFHSTRASDR